MRSDGQLNTLTNTFTLKIGAAVELSWQPVLLPGALRPAALPKSPLYCHDTWLLSVSKLINYNETGQDEKKRGRDLILQPRFHFGV